MRLVKRLLRLCGVVFGSFGAISIVIVLIKGAQPGVPSDWGMILALLCLVCLWLTWTSSTLASLAYSSLLSTTLALYNFNFTFEKTFLRPSSLSGIDFMSLALFECLLLAPALLVRLRAVRPHNVVRR